MTILHIETSTNICSVALSNRGKLLFEVFDDQGMNHARLLSPFVDKALTEMRKQNLTLDAVAVSGGPGSYTGLRIGVSTAKGLCYGYNIPLIAVPTLEVLATAGLSVITPEDNALLYPMIDARRMEVYTAEYSPSLRLNGEVTAEIITEDSFAEQLNEHICYFVGNGAEKCKSVLTHSNARFPDNIVLHAKHMITAAEKRFNHQEFVDVAYYEPFYLKEFVATIPKKQF